MNDTTTSASNREAAESSVRAHKVRTFLTFRERGEEAVKFYVSLFRNSKVIRIARWEEERPVAKGALMNAEFELDGHQFMAMDGGPYFKFDQGFSLFVSWL